MMDNDYGLCIQHLCHTLLHMDFDNGFLYTTVFDYIQNQGRILGDNLEAFRYNYLDKNTPLSHYYHDIGRIDHKEMECTDSSANQERVL